MRPPDESAAVDETGLEARRGRIGDGPKSTPERITMTTTSAGAGCPLQTPWGRATPRERVAPGLWAVSTPSHGGYYVESSALGRIPEAFRGATFTRSPHWYEEDCDWAIVARYFPEAFPADIGPRVEAILRHCHPRPMALTPIPNPRGGR
jgi:hypothetical protein